MAPNRTGSKASSKGKTAAPKKKKKEGGIGENENQQAVLGSIRLAKEKVALEGGGQFNEGTVYSIRSKDGQTSKMRLKNGVFIPYKPAIKVKPKDVNEMEDKEENSAKIIPSTSSSSSSRKRKYSTNENCECSKKMLALQEELVQEHRESKLALLEINDSLQGIYNSLKEIFELKAEANN